MQQSTSSFISETHFMTQESTFTEFIKKWTIDDIEFFDSQLEENELVMNVERNVFYKDIYVFVNRLKNMMNLGEENKLRAILSQCFRESIIMNQIQSSIITIQIWMITINLMSKSISLFRHEHFDVENAKQYSLRIINYTNTSDRIFAKTSTVQLATLLSKKRS
jgi:hypothetical protein